MGHGKKAVFSRDKYLFHKVVLKNKITLDWPIYCVDKTANSEIISVFSNEKSNVEMFVLRCSFMCVSLD